MENVLNKLGIADENPGVFCGECRGGSETEDAARARDGLDEPHDIHFGSSSGERYVAQERRVPHANRTDHENVEQGLTLLR